MSMIRHNEALELEFLVRKVYKCERMGVMGIANADYLERNPLDAAIAIFAPLYLKHKEISDIDMFFDTFFCLFGFPEDYQYNESEVRSYIDELNKLVNKYYNGNN